MLRANRMLIAVLLLASTAGRTLGQEQILWITDLRQARQLAEQQQRVVLLHFWSESCPPCRLLEQNVFNQPELIRVISAGFIPVKINVLQQTKYADFYKVDRVPMDILVDHTGKELYRTTSPQNMNNYLAMLDQVRAQVGVGAGRSLEAMAQNQLQKFSSALPPMLSGQEEHAASESINGDPAALAENPEPWRSAPGNDAAPSPARPQPAHVQNHFATTAPGSTTPTAEVSLRHENPYVQGGDPAGSSAPPSQPTNAARPWETSAVNPANNASLTETLSPARNDFSQPNPMTGAPANMMPPGQDGFASGQPPVNAGPQVGMPVLPNQVPPLALDGYCPVTLVLLSKWVKGDPRFGAIHRGRTYLLGSQSDQQRFFADPDRFSPALSGYDPVRFTESGQLVEGKREHGLFLTSSYYLFADENALSRFESQPHGYVNAVRQAMANSRPAGPQR